MKEKEVSDSIEFNRQIEEKVAKREHEVEDLIREIEQLEAERMPDREAMQNIDMELRAEQNKRFNMEMELEKLKRRGQH